MKRDPCRVPRHPAEARISRLPHAGLVRTVSAPLALALTFGVAAACGSNSTGVTGDGGVAGNEAGDGRAPSDGGITGRDAAPSPEQDGGDVTLGGDSAGGEGGAPAPPGIPAVALGDPHLLTFDRTRYDCQVWGETTLCLSGDDLEVQMRTHQLNAENVAIIRGVAARVGGDRVAIYLDGGTTQNGAATTFASGMTRLPGDAGAVYNNSGVYTIVWPDNSQLRVTLYGYYMGVEMFLSPSRSGVSGLLGSPGGEAGADLVPRGGGPPLVSPSATFEQFYGDGGYYSGYAGSWRIAPDASLFDYPDGESTQSPDITNLNFPTQLETADNLDGGEVAASALVCMQQNVTQDWLSSCELDVSLSGEAGAANAFVGAPAVSVAFDIVPEPTVIQETEGSYSGTWTWNGTGYNATWNNQAFAVMTVESFTTTSIVLDRTDTPTSSSAGLTAVYTGTISPVDGGGTAGSVVTGSAIYNWPGHFTNTTGTWSATWN